MIMPRINSRHTPSSRKFFRLHARINCNAGTFYFQSGVRINPGVLCATDVPLHRHSGERRNPASRSKAGP